MERTVVYFEKTGEGNTAACLDVAKKAIERYGYKHIIIASTTGETGLSFSEALEQLPSNIIIVTHSSGYREQNSIEMPHDVRKKIESHGAKVFTGTMLTHSIETAFAKKFSGQYPTLIVANTLRRFGEGAKVCCEIVMMAADAGLIPEGEEVLAVAGTAKGADTVMVLKSAASKRFLDLKMLEVLAKPRV